MNLQTETVLPIPDTFPPDWDKKNTPKQSPTPEKDKEQDGWALEFYWKGKKFVSKKYSYNFVRNLYDMWVAKSKKKLFGRKEQRRDCLELKCENEVIFIPWVEMYNVKIVR